MPLPHVTPAQGQRRFALSSYFYWKCSVRFPFILFLLEGEKEAVKRFQSDFKAHGAASSMTTMVEQDISRSTFEDMKFACCKSAIRDDVKGLICLDPSQIDGLIPEGSLSHVEVLVKNFVRVARIAA